ncbi:hypothetical protein JXB41_04150 [Candidatus Woesearchaeota archaeon]|nr:hypothetical protein [Candidatus Woesearchaeota archaeon]
MATFLDIGFLTHFSSVFVVIFVFTAVYAVLTFKKPIGENKGVNALISFAIAIIFILSEDAILIIKAAVPWWTIMIIVVTFVVIGVEAFGSSFPATTVTSFSTWILIIAIIIFVFAWSGVAGQKAGPYLGENTSSLTEAAAAARGDGSVSTGSFQDNLGATLFHPKVLGLVLILIVALFTVLFITYPIKLMPL